MGIVNSELLENVEEEGEDICRVCGKDDDEEYALLCDSCDGCYHTFCLVPQLEAIPEGEWHCTSCVAKTDITEDELKLAEVKIFEKENLNELYVGEARVR